MIFEIDFGGHVLAKIEVKEGELSVLAAINGYGEKVQGIEITTLTENQMTNFE